MFFFFHLSWTPEIIFDIVDKQKQTNRNVLLFLLYRKVCLFIFVKLHINWNIFIIIWSWTQLCLIVIFGILRILKRHSSFIPILNLLSIKTALVLTLSHYVRWDENSATKPNVVFQTLVSLILTSLEMSLFITYFGVWAENDLGLKRSFN